MNSKNKKESNYIWYCRYDTWSWDDGIRCRATSRKPTTKENAEKALDNHINDSRGHHYGEVIKLNKRQIKKYLKP
jgi:hypothetical protein